MRFVSDAPETREEYLFFDFDRYAAAISGAILDECVTPLTICINGPWGTGKSSLLQAIERCLKAGSDKPLTVRFDAWKYLHSNSLYVALIRKVFDGLEEEGLLEKLKARFNDPTRKRYDLWRASLSIIGDALGVDLDPENFVKASSFRENIAFYDEFEAAFKSIIADISKERLLVILIDDLDRCTPGQAVEVLEAIKLFLETSGCVFVLAIDRLLVQASIKAYYKDIAIQNFEKQYLDKLVHINFDIPAVSSEGVQAYIEQTFRTDEQIWRTVAHQCAIALAGNPRRIKKFVNQFGLIWEIVQDIEYVGMDGANHHFDKLSLIEWLLLRESSPSLITDIQLRVSVEEKASLLAALIEASLVEENSQISEVVTRHALSVGATDPCWSLFRHGTFGFGRDLVHYMQLGQRFTTTSPEQLTEGLVEVAPEHVLVGERLRSIREAKQLTQDDVAQMLGLTESVVSLWERGIRSPRRESVIALARSLKLGVQETNDLLSLLGYVLLHFSETNT